MTANDYRRQADAATLRLVDNRNADDMMRWREAQAEALRERLARETTR